MMLTCVRVPSRIESSIRLKSTFSIPIICRLLFLLLSGPLNLRCLHLSSVIAGLTTYLPCFDFPVFAGRKDRLCLLGQAIRWVALSLVAPLDAKEKNEYLPDGRKTSIEQSPRHAHPGGTQYPSSHRSKVPIPLNRWGRGRVDSCCASPHREWPARFRKKVYNQLHIRIPAGP